MFFHIFFNSTQEFFPTEGEQTLYLSGGMDA